MSKRIAILVSDEMHGLLWELGELRGESISKIAGALLDREADRWIAEIARWKTARRREEEIQLELEELRADCEAEGEHAYTGKRRGKQ